ncbi:MAG: RNA-binding domain-containing protein [Promethearchaeati archaeon SRVP18_Atabeyarchaeia-1]
MSEIHVTEISMEVFSHATEEPSKVLKALFSVVPANCRSKLDVKEEAVRGYFRNPIIIYRAKLPRRQEAEDTFSMLAQGVIDDDKVRLGKEIERRIDDSGKLFLRLDKQAAYMGEIAVRQDDDTIKMTIRFTGYPARKDRIINTCRETGLIR